MKNSVNEERERFSSTSRKTKTENNEIFLKNFAEEKIKKIKDESEGESPGEESRLLSGKVNTL